MKVLNETYTEIRALVKQCADASKKKDFAASIGYLDQAWGLLPDKKHEYDESYNLAKALTKFHIKAEEYSEAEKWAKTLMKCDPERIDDGEREFIAGTAFFAKNDMTEAQKFFQTAWDKSEGRVFEGQDPKYAKLLT